MTWIDWVVALGFLGYSIYDVLRKARGNRTLEGYFAGRRSIPWWAAGLSVMATQISAITVLGTTGQGHDTGMEFVQIYLAHPFAMVILAIVFVPLYRAAPILTAYEFLERRLGRGTRALCSGVFLLSRGLALGVAIAAPAVILAVITGLSVNWTILAVGVLTICYTVFGGVISVIWMDVKQMSVLFLGLALVFGILLVDLLPTFGTGGLLAVLGAAGKLNALELEPASTLFTPRTAGAGGAPSFWEDRYNFWSCMLGGLFLNLAYFGTDHSQVQRILTNHSADESRKALMVSAFVKVPMQVVVLAIGVLMYVFFVVKGAPLLFDPGDQIAARDPAVATRVAALQERYDAASAARRALAERVAAPEQTPAEREAAARQFRAAVAEVDRVRAEARTVVNGGRPKSDTNYIYTWFILHHLPPVLLGLVIAAVFAAALSSSDSVLNSLAGAFVVDFYRPFLAPHADEAHVMRASRVITVLGGLFATGSAMVLVDEGSLIEVINLIGSFVYGSMLGVFLLAAFCPWVGERAAFLGVLGGLATVGVVHLTLRVEFLWYNVLGCLGVFATALPLALLRRR
ncbi:MAG: hypothetical protein IT458_17590 [Planctomycetes bacterium]|nr:hypothetical protein [Planctomycetota bacterium]